MTGKQRDARGVESTSFVGIDSLLSWLQHDRLYDLLRINRESQLCLYSNASTLFVFDCQESKCFFSGMLKLGANVDSLSFGDHFPTFAEEQLGLNLESTKGPVEILVIDGVERPSENQLGSRYS